MKVKKFLAVILSIIALFIIFSHEVYPRAGAGHKYRAPKRRKTTTRKTTRYKSTPYRRTTYTKTVTSTRRNYNQSGTTSRGGRACCGSTVGCGIGILVLIVVIIFIILSILKKKKGKQGGKQTQQGQQPLPIQPVDIEALPPVDEEKVKEQLEELRKKDSFFSEKVFLDKAQTSFFEIQRAWSKNDLEPVRKYMSEAQFNRMNMQLSEYVDKGRKNVIEDLVIGGIKTTEAGIEGEYDFIKARVHASMSDKTYDSDGNIVEGSKEIIPMAEYWTFVRKQGAKTNQDGGRTVSHNCPNCGAPVETGESGKCPYCDATLTAASFDWVLDTITQAVEEIED
ncbi:MAG: TIM44-like domain-containing protein [Candidatus Eremiobacteraeota bacterium]|nr:TIM44-like domain-containing protein [Candidatus Eremiobacteraeota bacterium]